MGREQLEKVKEISKNQFLLEVKFVDRFGKMTDDPNKCVHALLKFSNEEDELKLTNGEFRSLRKHKFKLSPTGKAPN